MMPIPKVNRNFVTVTHSDSDSTIRKGVVYKNLKHEMDSIYERNNIRQLIINESGLRPPDWVPEEHLLIMYDEAISNHIPFCIFFRWIYAESVWQKDAISKSGAIGYTQLMPSTYGIYRKKLHLKRNAKNNIKIGAYYLKELYDYWTPKITDERLRWGLALASYRGNISHVRNKVPRGASKYVEFILKNGYE